MIKAVGLRRSFRGVEALRGVSLEAAPGEAVGLVRPNGAGRTTTMMILAGLLKPGDGYAEVLGVRTDSPELRRTKRWLAYLPEEVMSYDNLTGRAFIEFIHGLYGVDNMKEAAELSGLGPRLDDKVKANSKGMKRRLVAAALLSMGARVLLLDELTSGVDVLHAVKEYAKSRGAAVMCSSHNMLEVQTICDRVHFIDRGMIVDSGTPAELLSRA